MTWIKTVRPEDATGTLKETYDELKAQGRSVSSLVSAYSLKPAFLRAARELSHTVTFGGSSLGQRKEELIATVIAAKLKCTF